ncbi:YfhE family protein [Oceanobacillus rekensis]|nr:YfhE family protein [Oceanobacillus rekensis]
MAKMKPGQAEKFLSKTQEVLYQKEFKHADRIYNQISQKGNRR